MNKTLALMLAGIVWLGGCSGRTDDVGDADELAIAAALEAANEVVRLRTNMPSLLTGAGDRANIVAVVADDQNRVVADRQIEFSADGGVLQNIVAQTNEVGEASAELSLAGDYRNRNITVTASMGGQSTSILVSATGTSVAMSAPETILIGDTAELEFTLTAGSGQPIPNETLSFSSAAGNSISQNSAVTDANGVARLAISTTAGADVVTVTAFDGTVSHEFDLLVVENEQAVDTPIRVRVISNQSSIETGGNDVARITTLVTDESNRVISGKTVEFSSTGGVLQNISSVTNEAGQADAELSLAGDFRNQEIVVSAQVDEEVGSVLVTTSGSSLAVSGPTALVSGNTADLEVTLSSGNGQPIANEVVSIRSAAGNILSADTVTTDASGKAKVSVGSAAGSDTITVEALGTTVMKSHDIQVAADILSVVSPDNYSALEVDTPAIFQVQWESDGELKSDGVLDFSITSGGVRAADGAGPFQSRLENVDVTNGIASIEIFSTTAGPATITFSDADNPDTVSQFEVAFESFNAQLIAVESTPGSVGTGNSSTIVATVTDSFGNPVRGVDVDFTSPNLNGGRLSPVTAETDESGQARISFNAGGYPTAEDELVITATATDFPDAEPASTNLTVTERQLNVIIGLSGSITEADADTRYRKAGLVQVTDGAGRPVSDATVLVSMIPTTYIYGNLVTIDVDGDGEDDRWAYGLIHTCKAEDKNKNRILDTTNEDLNGNSILDNGEDQNQNGLLDVNEDVNNNGVLDPSDPGLIDADPVNSPTVIGGQITTDANGVGFFSLAYPQSNAWWFDVQISARVQALGVEAVATYDTDLEALSSDVDDPEAEPPNFLSPYGAVDLSNLPECESP
jgi:hypothetical protein